MFDSVIKAVQFIRENWSKFFTLEQTLQSRLTSIDRSLASAKASNDQSSLGRLIVAKSQTYALMREYQDLKNKMNPFRSILSTSNQLGVLPVWIAAGGITLATSLYLFFQKVQNEGKALELIQKGILAPSEAKAILSGGIFENPLGNINRILMWGAVAYALFLFGPQLSKRLS